jgi:hypothetical protein
MKVYKYKSNYNRDIKLLSQSKIFVPCKQNLNDPFEGIIIPKILEDYEKLKPNLLASEYERNMNLLKEFLVKIGYIGIFSLSKTWKNELLWAHYSDSHKGFCIEYELDDLFVGITRPSFPPRIIEVDYSNKTPIFSIKNLYNIDEAKILKTLIGTKSISWKYEKEIRTILKSGEQEINEKSITSIIFGINASKKNIFNTIKQMRRKIKFYKVEMTNNYGLKKKEIK